MAAILQMTFQINFKECKSFLQKYFHLKYHWGLLLRVQLAIDSGKNWCGGTIEVWEWRSNFIPLYWACDYLSLLGLKLNNVSKGGHTCLNTNSCWKIFYKLFDAQLTERWQDRGTDRQHHTICAIQRQDSQCDVIRWSNITCYCMIHFSDWWKL